MNPLAPLVDVSVCDEKSLIVQRKPFTSAALIGQSVFRAVMASLTTDDRLYCVLSMACAAVRAAAPLMAL